MKKQIILAMGCVLMMASASFAATFPTNDPHTLVSSNGSGVVEVKVADSGWEMILYCQDGPLMAGCGNKFGVQPFEQSGGVMRYQIPADAVADGQIGFNFKKDGLWLLIPDCRVKTAGQVKMGMSYPNSGNPESGGAHFVYIGGGIQPYSPIESGSWCDERSARVVAPSKPGPGTSSGRSGYGGGGNDQGAVASATKQSAAAAHNSAAAANQSAAATNSSTANTTSLINVNQVAGKGGKKGGKNVSVVYAPNATQKVKNYNIRGNSADVKVYANKGGKGGVKNVITYVGPSFQTIHFGVKGAENYDVHTCTKCHHASAADDERARKLVLKAMSSALVDDKKKKGKK